MIGWHKQLLSYFQVIWLSYRYLSSPPKAVTYSLYLLVLSLTSVYVLWKNKYERGEWMSKILSFGTCMGKSFRGRNKQATSHNWTPLWFMVELVSLFGDEEGHRAYTPHTYMLTQTTFAVGPQYTLMCSPESNIVIAFL